MKVKNEKRKKTKKPKEILLMKSKKHVISPELLYYRVKVYNGIRYILLRIQESHIGYKYGHFIVTKKRCIFKKDKKKKKKTLKK